MPAQVQQWAPDSLTRIGPPFGEGKMNGGGLAIDRSGGSTDGQIYVSGVDNFQNSVSVFSAPVPIPDVNYRQPVENHTSVTVSADVETWPEGRL